MYMHMKGCGKTTLTTIISEMFRLQGINCIAMSIDGSIHNHYILSTVIIILVIPQ